MSLNHYEVVGVNCDASPDVIKKAFRKKALECHPDITKGRDKEFRSLREAYQILIDPSKRMEYDRTLLNGRRTTFARSQRASTSNFNRARRHSRPVDRPYGRRYCEKCGGHGTIYASADNWSRCNFCEGSGLYPESVDVPWGRKKCEKCNGFKKTWDPGIEMHNLCNFCDATGLYPESVDVPWGRKKCEKCNGFKKTWDSGIEMHNPCSFCGATGLCPVRG